VVDVEHASDTIKAEAIELVLIHPESQIAQEKPQDFVVAVVEEAAIPQIMLSPSTPMEVLVIRTVELVQAIQNILGSMAVNNIE
jgi:pentose-5-phosphate-3-epimerase